MSTVIFRHDLNHSYKTKNGEKFTVKETIIDGAKGLSFVYLNKQGAKKFYRIVVREEAPDSFSVREKTGDKEDPEKKINMTELTKLLKADELKFVREYIKNERDNYRKALKGGKKKSKKASKKRSSKKKSMNGGTKKASKKRSSKKKSMNGGTMKRSSKKATKKASKKRSTKKTVKRRSSKKKSMNGGTIKRSSKKASKKRSSKKKLKGFNTALY